MFQCLTQKRSSDTRFRLEPKYKRYLEPFENNKIVQAWSKNTLRISNFGRTRSKFTSRNMSKFSRALLKLTSSTVKIISRSVGTSQLSRFLMCWSQRKNQSIHKKKKINIKRVYFYKAFFSEITSNTRHLMSVSDFENQREILSELRQNV